MANGFQTLCVNQLASIGYGSDYPFVKAVTSVKYLLGDLYLAYVDDNNAFVLPLRVLKLTGFNGASGDKNVIVEDANGAVVFDTTTATSRTANAWGENLITLSWIDGETTLRCTMRLVAPQWEPGLTWAATINLSPPLVLDARTYMQVPKRVRSIIVSSTQFNAVDLILAEGFNMQMLQADNPAVDGGRLVHRISMRARPGDGIGTPIGCNDTTLTIQRINATGPNENGDFIFSASNCYRIQRPVEVVSDSPRSVQLHSDALGDADAVSSLQIFNDCAPCCTCEDYVKTYEGIRRLRNRYESIGTQAETTRNQFAKNVERWQQQAACRLATPLRLVLNAEPLGVLYIGGSQCNMTTCCAIPLVLRTTFEYFNNGVVVDVSSDFGMQCKESKRNGADTKYQDVAYRPFVNWPTMDHHFDFADPQSASHFRNRIKFPGATDADTVRVTLSAHLPAIVDSKGVPCPLPDPATIVIPPAVQAIWVINPVVYPVRALVQSTIGISQTAGCCQ